MGIPYFDAHCDTLSVLHSRGAEWSLGANAAQVDIDRLSAYSPAAQVFAIWGGHYEEKLALLRRGLARDGRAVLCRTAEEVRKANAAGKVAALLSVEGAEILGCSIERLREARERDGLAMINLCWNSDNALCGAAMDSGSGLTDAGRAFVRAAQDVGVAVDLSHASERTFWDVLEIAEKPVIASHSNAAALSSEFPRNLTDEQFTALVKCGGGAGLNLCADFIGLGGISAPAVRTSNISSPWAGKRACSWARTLTASPPCRAAFMAYRTCGSSMRRCWSAGTAKSSCRIFFTVIS